MDLELPPEARALLDAVVAIGSDLEPRGVLSRFVASARELTDAEYGVLGILDEDGSYVDMVPSEDAAPLLEKIGEMPQGHGLLGLVPREQRSIRVASVADHPASDGSFPDTHPVIEGFLGVPVTVGDKVFGHLFVGNKRDGGEFTTTDQGLVEALGRTAGVMIEHARAFQQAEWRRRWLHLTATIATRGSGMEAGTRRTDDILEELIEVLRELCDARLVSLVRLCKGGLLEVRQSAGETSAVAQVVEALADTIRRTVESDEPVRLPVERGVVTLVVPVHSKFAGVGALVVERAVETPALRGVMLDLVSVSADRMALIVDREKALRERARHLLAKDRDRIARDLHDLVIQRLFATGMQLQAANNLSLEELRRRVIGAVEELDATIKELRSTIFELTAGANRPLLEEVRTLLAEYAVVLGFQPVLRVTGPVDRTLLQGAVVHVLTTLREALSNIARHAKASSVTVELNARPAWFSLRVTDDGVGFDPATVTRGGGSTSLRTRAEELGGHLTVTTAPGAGTTVEWVIPTMG